jgi:hypothetical protein
VVPSDGVAATFTEEGGSGRLDFDFQGHGGYVVLRRTVDLELPGNYAFTLRLRGNGPPNNLELKLLDASGENVWWHVRRSFTFPAEVRALRSRKREIGFAWGPAGGGELKTVAALEIAVSAAEGGKGSVWLDELGLEELPPAGPYRGTPVASADVSSGMAGQAIDGDRGTAWTTELTGAAWAVDFGAVRELGGLALHWQVPRRPGRVGVELSLDGLSWAPAFSIEGAGGAVDWLPFADGEARFVRLGFGEAPAGLALTEVEVLPLAVGAERNELLATVAKAAPRGDWPRPFLGETVFWTVVGRDGGAKEGLLAEDGRLESGKGGWSLEPFIQREGGLLTWTDGTFVPSLLDGDLPIPSVRWEAGDGLALEVTALAPVAGPERLLARYRLVNGGDRPRRGRLALALRPLQVNPPWQFLNSPGGASAVGSLAVGSSSAAVEGKPALRFAPPADRAGALAFAGGSLVEQLRAGKVPAAAQVDDPQKLASAAFTWDFALAPGEAKIVIATIPWDGAAIDSADEAAFDRDLAAARAAWRQRLSTVRLTLPPAAGDLARQVRTALAHILINRDGAALQPGSRSYERSWIRDGALTSSALLRFGLDDAARDFLAWFAPYQFENGKVPCCVDRRGSDPVPENDSHGELLFLAREVYRQTGDRALAERVYPQVAKAVAYLDRLRRERRTPEYQAPEKRAYFGLLPESISHEGYSAKPVHSYWDDFWALRGLRDAVALALALGHAEDARAWDAIRAEFETDLGASLRRTVADHRLAYIPGSVELADFDATSTTVALDPGLELDSLPQAELRGTFERYVKEAFARFEGRAAWDAYTPYELRNVGALVRLGECETAWQLLRHLLAHRRPEVWHQWPEVIFHDERAPRFLGDLPHTWVGSDFLRSVTDLFWWERDDRTLVLADGLPKAWLESGAIQAEGFRTPWGTLDLTVERRPEGLRIDIGGSFHPPKDGRFQLRSPLGRSTREALVDGKVAARGSAAREIAIPARRAVVVFR